MARKKHSICQSEDCNKDISHRRNATYCEECAKERHRQQSIRVKIENLSVGGHFNGAVMWHSLPKRIIPCQHSPERTDAIFFEENSIAYQYCLACYDLACKDALLDKPFVPFTMVDLSEQTRRKEREALARRDRNRLLLVSGY